LVPGVDKPVRYTNIETTRLDTKGLKTAYPCIYEEFARPSIYRRLYIPEEV